MLIGQEGFQIEPDVVGFLLRLSSSDRISHGMQHHLKLF